MSAAVAGAAAAAAGAAAANNAANAARMAAYRAHCQDVVKTFDAHGATPQAAREYAECVRVVYPDEGAAMTGFDVVIVCIFIALVVALVIFLADRLTR